MIATAAARPNPDTMLLVRMNESADLSSQALMPRGAERRQAVWDELQATAQRTQQPAQQVIDDLASKGLVESSRSIPLGNAIAVTVKDGAQQAVVDALNGVSEIGSVLANQGKFGTMPSVGATSGAAMLGRPSTPAAAPAAVIVEEPAEATIAWGVSKIGAPQLWSKGITGEGVTVGVLDSGLDTKHEALKSVYRGTQTDGSQQHDYNWVDTAGFQSGAFTATPSDDGGHGSHVAGTIAGSTTTQKIGVAPGAKVIGAKMVFEDSIASTISALDGLQFMLAPTKTDGTSPNPAKGVDVINNSWGAGEWESRETQGAFDSLKAAGILLVNSAGNEGPGAGTVSAPGAYPGHLSIAASDARDGVARFSSRGPSTFGGAVGDTPNISAPGVRINSVRAGGGYTQMDGTSMAAPHVTGAVALMLQANPQASYDEIRDALQSTATDIADPGVDFTAGHGRINVDKAVEALTAAQ